MKFHFLTKELKIFLKVVYRPTLSERCKKNSSIAGLVEDRLKLRSQFLSDCVSSEL